MITHLLGIESLSILLSIAAFLLVGVGLAIAALLLRNTLISQAPCVLTVNRDSKLKRAFPGGCTLLTALSSCGIPIPASCGGKATCKQCRVQVTSETEEPLETEIATFSKKQIRQGWRLSCQTKLKRDTDVHVDEHILGVKHWQGKVISNENVATFIKELVVEVPEIIPYRSGGYLQIHVPPYKTRTDDWKATIDSKYQPDWERFGMFGQVIDFSDLKEEVIRAYSAASYPAEGKTIKFTIRIANAPTDANGRMRTDVPWGICSSYTFGLKAGDNLSISGPYGESFMIEDDRALVFLIGGAGSSFGRSHILHLFRTEKTSRRVDLWYGARALRENIYQKEFEELARTHPNFTYNLALSEPLEEDLAGGWPKDDPIKTNFLFRAFEKGQLSKMEDPESALYYVCGPPMHNKSVMQLLDSYGVPHSSILLDDFGI